VSDLHGSVFDVIDNKADTDYFITSILATITQSGGTYTATAYSPSGGGTPSADFPTPELGSGVSFGILLSCLAVWAEGARRRRRAA